MVVVSCRNTMKRMRAKLSPYFTLHAEKKDSLASSIDKVVLTLENDFLSYIVRGGRHLCFEDYP